MLSFSFVYLIPNYSQQRPYSVHRIPAWTKAPIATGVVLGFLITSGWWPGSVETPKVLCDICHAMQISWHIKWHMLPFNSPSSVSAGSALAHMQHSPLSHMTETEHPSVHLELDTALQLPSWPPTSDPSIFLFYFFLFSCFLYYKYSY